MSDLSRFRTKDERLFYLMGASKSLKRIKELEEKNKRAWSECSRNKIEADELRNFIGSLLKELSVGDIHRKIIAKAKNEQ